MSIFSGSNGTLFHEILIDTNKSDGVTGRNIWNSFDLTTHHDDSSLDVLDVEIVLGSGNVVRSHDSDLLTGSDGTRENTTESIESTLIVSWDHLGDEDRKRTVLITSGDSFAGGIISRSFIQVSSSVCLSLDWGRKLEDDHFKKSISGIDPLLENVLHEMFTLESSLVTLKRNTNVREHLIDFVHLTVHGGSAESDDWFHTEGNEGSLEFRTIIGFLVVLPLLGLGIEEVVTPKLDHHLVSSNTELGSIDLGEMSNGESPTEESGSHSTGTKLRVNGEDLSHGAIIISANNDVDVLNNSEEVLIHVFTVNLKLKNGSVNLVDNEYWLNLFDKSLSQYSLGLYGDTFDVINNDKSTISDSKSGCYFRREIDVTG
jgi:hypothetical protein